MTTGQVNDFSTQGLGIAVGSQIGVAGSVGINVITITTTASIGAGTIVDSYGGLNVQAANDETFQNIAFTAALSSGDAGAGAAVTVNVLNNATNAFLDSNVQANVAGMTNVAADSTLKPSQDPIPNSSADTIIATGNLTEGSDEVSNINASVLGVLGQSTNTPFVGEPVTATGEGSIPFGTLILKTGSKTFTSTLKFGSTEITTTDDMFTDPLKKPPKVGDTVSGPGIVPGATIEDISTNYLSGKTTITLSEPVYANGSASLDATSLRLTSDATAGGAVVFTLTPEDEVLKALSSLHRTNFAAGAGASSGDAGVAGSFVVNVIDQSTHAFIGSGAAVNTLIGVTGHPTAGLDEGVTVSATDTMTIDDLAGAIGASKNVGAGAALDVNIVDKDVTAYIAQNATVDAAQNVTVSASTDGTYNSLAAMGALGGSASIAGAVTVEVLTLTTKAYIDDHATVTTPGNVLVQAVHSPTISTIDGNITVGGDAGFGASVSTVIEIDHTEAYIAANATVTAHGQGAAMQVLVGDTPTNTTTARGVAIVAATFPDVQTIAAGGAVGGDIGLSGSAAINEARLHDQRLYRRGGDGHSDRWLARRGTGRHSPGVRPAHAVQHRGRARRRR